MRDTVKPYFNMSVSVPEKLMMVFKLHCIREGVVIKDLISKLLLEFCEGKLDGMKVVEFSNDGFKVKTLNVRIDRKLADKFSLAAANNKFINTITYRSFLKYEIVTSIIANYLEGKGEMTGYSIELDRKK